MRVSQFEIYRLVQRSLEALGAGYGVDRDGARAVAWLEARGLPGLLAFAAALLRLERGIPEARLESRSATEIRIDADGGPAITFGGAALDLLAARAGPAGSARLLCHCRLPLFLIPPTVEIAGHRFAAISWRHGEGEARVLLEPEGALSVFQGSAQSAHAVLLSDPLGDVTVEISSTTIAPPSGLVKILDGTALARNFERSLSQGIEVDNVLWHRLDAVAARVQVPASVVSRERGAGGGDANT